MSVDSYPTSPSTTISFHGGDSPTVDVSELRKYEASEYLRVVFSTWRWDDGHDGHSHGEVVLYLSAKTAEALQTKLSASLHPAPKAEDITAAFALARLANGLTQREFAEIVGLHVDDVFAATEVLP